VQNDDLDATTLKVYVYLVKTGQPCGPRDVMRGADLSSPSVAYRHLQKLVDLGLVQKNKYCMYEVKEKVDLEGFFWLGKSLIPRFILYSLFFMGLLTVEVVVATIRFLAREPIEPAFMLLLFITTISIALFLFEGIRLRSKIRGLSKK
jgi:hypothetical protein